MTPVTRLREASARQTLGVADFTGGLNTRVSKFLIRDNQCVEIKNYFFGVGGVLKVRPGSTRKNAISLGSGAPKGGARYYPAVGSAELLVDHGTTINGSTDGGSTFASKALPVVLSAYSWSHYVQVRDLIYRSDGVNTPLKYNGTTVTRWGIVAPASAGSGAETTGGSLTTTSTYRWKVTYVSATSESSGNATAGSVTLTGVNNRITLSSVPTSSDTQVTKRRIYRTQANGAIFYFEREINDNVTTTSELSVADSALGVEMPEDKDPPPTDLLFTALFKNRIFGVPASDRRTLRFTELFEYEAWPVDFAVTIPFPEGDKITGLRARGDLLFIFGTSTIFVLVGDSAFNFTIRQTFADEGSTSAFSVVEVENVVMYASRFGFHAFDGANGRVLSFEIEPTLRDEIDLNTADSIAGVYDYENRVVRWSVLTKNAVRVEIVFDLVRRAWTRSDRALVRYVPFLGAGDTGQLYSLDASAGYAWQENQGSADNGANINARYRTKTFDMRAPRQKKRLWHLWCDFKPSTGTLAIECLGDSGAVSDTFSPDVSGGASSYGVAVYGVDSYGGALIASFDEGFTYDPATAKDAVVRYCEYLVEYTGNSPFELYRLDTEFETEQWLRKT